MILHRRDGQMLLVMWQSVSAYIFLHAGAVIAEIANRCVDVLPTVPTVCNGGVRTVTLPLKCFLSRFHKIYYTIYGLVLQVYHPPMCCKYCYLVLECFSSYESH